MAQAPNGPEFLATYQGAAEKVARLLLMRGETSVEAAAKRAMDLVFYDHWEVVDQVRVPKQGGQPIVPASAVRATQRLVIDALPKMDLAAPAGEKGVSEASRKDALIRNVRSFGYWMTTADDKGMVLMAGPGLPVLMADGKPVMLGFDSVLAAAGHQAAVEGGIWRAAAGFDPGSDDAPPAAGGYPWLQQLFTRDAEMRDRRQKNRAERAQ
jgi:hypothetical protein